MQLSVRNVAWIPQPFRGSHLGLGIGGIAKAFHQGQGAIIWLASACKPARLQVGRRHGAGRRKTHPVALPGGAVALAEVRDV
jgi:hypothetical protein